MSDKYAIVPLDKQRVQKIAPIPLTSFLSYVVGGRGQGKSTMLINMIMNKNLLSNRFNDIYVISPTAKLDAKFNIVRDAEITVVNKPLNNILRKEQKNNLKKILSNPNDIHDIDDTPNEVQFLEEPSLEFFEDIIKEQKYIIEKYGKKVADKILIILDDCIGNKTLNSQTFKKFIFNSRHYEVSVMILSQSYYALPKSLRLNVSQLILFEIANQKELATIYEENSIGLEAKEFMAIYKEIINEAFAFANINYFNPRGKRLYKNFTDLIEI